MKIHSTRLDADCKPVQIKVTLTAAEAAFLCRTVGKLTPPEAASYGVEDTYHSLADFFGKFYDGGVHDFPTAEPARRTI
ncbi:hypothetical protein AB0G06_43350 [Nonomuraea dietziae]|uniref:hypothetical protein n=1 Tax=Nonomuraea dietziae TaxID=65515 RepID=UPI0033D06DF3